MISETNLQHVGVLGMKWGRRKQRVKSNDYITSRKIKAKKLDEMSNEEIAILVKRLQLEQQIKDINSSNRRKGQKILGSFLNGPFKQVAIGVVTKVATKRLQDILESRSNG